MEISFKESILQAVVLDGRPLPEHEAEVVRELRFVIGIMRAAPNENSLKALSCLQFRKLKGRGQCSVSLTTGAELHFRVSGLEPRLAVLEGIRKRRRRAVA